MNICPTPFCPTPNIDKSVQRFERYLHIQSVFASSEELIPLSNPKIYVRSKWTPPAWNISLALKRCLLTFRKSLEPKFRFRPFRHNLLPHQRRTIGYIKSNPSLVVVQTNKGLGPGAIEPREYIQYAIRDHLGDKRTYQLLTPAATSYRATKVQNMLEKWIQTYLDMLSKEERKCLRTHLRQNEEPWGFLYLLFNVHKNPLKTQPVVSYCGNILHPLGQLITERLQPLAKLQKSYFQDSFTLKK